MNVEAQVVSTGGRRFGVVWLLVLAPLLGCKGLINVNGKPVGGGNSSSSGGGSPSSGGSSSSSGGNNASYSSSGSDRASASEAQPLSDDEYFVVKAEGMNDAAVHKPGRIPWCPAGAWKGPEVWDKGRLGRSINGRGYYSPGSGEINGVEQLCQWADDPTWQRQATYIVQLVMNSEKVSQDEAVERIKKYIAANQAAKAKEGREPTDEERFEFHASHMTEEKPASGVEAAKIGAVIPWCDGIKITDRWEPGRIGRTINSKYGISGTIEGALHLCQRPKDASWRKQAEYTLQKWMNWTKQSQADAVASFKARIQIDKFKADHDATCKSLEVGPEIGGETKAYSVAHRKFFGCNEHSEELWRASGGWDDGALTFYFDADDSLESELIRLTWLYQQVGDPGDKQLPSKDASDNRVLLDYAVASVDFASIDGKAIDKVLAKAPFNTTFAKVVTNETVATLKWRKKYYDDAVEKLIKTGGDEYADILREAPKQGYAEWKKVTAPWKGELDASRAFEKKLSNPSRKVLAGCSGALMPGAQKLIKGYKKGEYNEVVNQIASDPIASLLLSRLAICLAYEKVYGGSGALKDLVQKGRDLRGPRSMAYYAVVDAVVAALKDRPKLLLNLSNYYYRTNNLVSIYAQEFNFSGGMPYDPEKSYEKGYVKEVKKSGDGLEVVFKTDKLRYPEYNCRDTRKPIRITNDGRIEYEQHCVPTGKMLTQDNTPRPIKVHPLLAAEVKPGAYIVAHGSDGASVVYVKKKADDKKIQTFFGFSL